MSDRLRIVLEAELRSPLHILGPGRHVALVDRPVELDAQGYPIIPASSMRGRIRAHLERLLRQMGQPVCAPPSPEQMCPHAGHDGYCMACRVFGSPWRPAAMVNGDLRLVRPCPKSTDVSPDPLPNLLRSERTSVGISRRLGTAQAERLFTIETVDTSFGAAKLVFEGEMVGQATPEEAGWLLAAVPLVTHLGGSKARGLGGISLRAKEVCWWREGEWQSADVNRLIEEVLDHATT